MTARRLIMRDWEAAAWDAGRLSAVVRPRVYRVPCPLGPPGQRLWIAESWCMETEDYEFARHSKPAYKADGRDYNDYDGALLWRSPATMPRWASRSDAVHQGSRLVRVQEITEDEARACGVGEWQPCTMRWVSHDPLKDFAQQFVRDHGQAAWAGNLWVWVHKIGRPTQ